MRTWSRALALPLLLVLVGCRGEPALRERPLLDGHHQPDVLVEAAELELPPATSGNRFLSGWFPVPRTRGGSGLVPLAAGPRLELVQLERRRRVLILRTRGGDLGHTEVVARLGDREIDRAPLTERVRLKLPRDLPLGRVPIDLSFGGDESVVVQWARLNPVLDSEEPRFRDGAIVQSPYSAIDFVQDFAPGSVLLGRFQPPGSWGEDQRFAVALEAADGEISRAFEATSGGEQELGIALPEAAGPIRVRLEAAGQGGPGRWLDLRVAETVAPRPRVEAPRRPRIVVLYLFDALRADYVGHLGGPEGVSPELDRLAAEGVTFTDHSSVAPNTKPSVKTLFIGRPFLVRGHERLPTSGPTTLAEAFESAGYTTFSISGSPWVSKSFGTDRGFLYRPAKAQYRSPKETGVDYNDNAERVHRLTLEALDTLEARDRAFVYMHTMHPHNPYRPPEPFYSRYAAGIDSDIDGGTATLLAIHRGRVETTPADRERLRALYAAGLDYNDSELGKLMRELESRYEPGEVLMVFTSDHGEELFEHGSVLHGYTLFRDQLHVPLVFWWPGVLEPRRVETGSDHLDLSATLRSLVEDPGAAGHGWPLWDLMSGDAVDWPKRVRFSAASSLRGGIFGAQSQRLKLIWAPRTPRKWGMGGVTGRSWDAEYLFDLEKDPGETTNLAGQRSLEADWLRARLAAWIERGKLEEVGSDTEEEVDAETLERLRALGYVD